VVTTTSPLLLHHADRVALLTDGVVTAMGSHEELVCTSSDYRRVVGRTLQDDDSEGEQEEREQEEGR